MPQETSPGAATNNKAPVNRHEIRVVGMSRSGNHAILHWITEQIDGRACYLNCVQPKSNPFDSALPLDTGRPYAVNYTPFDLDAERSGRFTQKDALLYSYEDCFLGTVCNDTFERNRERWVGPSERRTDVLILRDPYNLFASRRRAGYATVAPHIAVRIWKQHAREFLREREHLGPDLVRIRYNAWCTDRAYRRDIAEQLGLMFTDAGIDTVPSTGEGSSFDGTAYDGRASEMDTLGRWRHFADDPDYRALFDEQVQDFSDRIFGPIPGTEALLSLQHA
jgi:hypothetical protein